MNSKINYKHTFDLGEEVDMIFNGTVEGVPVTVKKRLVVHGIRIRHNGLIYYDLYDETLEKTYEQQPVEKMLRVEPVIQEISKARRSELIQMAKEIFNKPVPTQADEAVYDDDNPF